MQLTEKGTRTADTAVFILLCICWGTTWTAIKFAVDDHYGGLPPIFGVATRFSFAAVLMLLLARIRGVAFPRRLVDHARLALVGVLSFCLSYILVYEGETRISSGLTAVLFATFPFFIAILTHFLIPGERLNAWKLSGVALGFGGVAVLFYHDLGLGGDPAVGILMGIGAALVSSISNVYGKRLLQKIPVLTFNALGMLYGTVAVWLAWWLLEPGRKVSWNHFGITATLYLVVFGTVIPFIGYFWLIKRLDTTRVAMLTFITPVVAIIIDWLVMHETLTAGLFAGSGLILGGVVLTLRGSRRVPKRG